ncbi:HNH endonuclease signature motif containing protein [Agromyces mangrovi Wang et al. 2018]|uniref:HNH endonuclease signature motif containing protein n=1 Tax=Agromyces mangrovi TaxID=1858653 RepID=UPI00257227B1|nr:HNH endonuclease signature motif containing protein [Agromyces mangrovi]
MEEADEPGRERPTPFAARSVSFLELLLAESLARSRRGYYESPVRLVFERGSSSWRADAAEPAAPPRASVTVQPELPLTWAAPYAAGDSPNSNTETDTNTGAATSAATCADPDTCADSATLDSDPFDSDPFDALTPDRALDRLVAIEAEIAALQAERAEVLADLAADADERAAVTAAAADRAPRPEHRVRELERRSLVAEVACALRLPERSAERLIDEGESLTLDLSATLESLRSGTISYRHAQRMIDHALSLPARTRPEFESVALPLAARLTPARFDARARRLRERMHPDSIAERTRRAIDDRTVSLEPARDGMAWLHALLPAAPAAEAFARVRAAAASLARPDGEQRTESQLRADVLSDLLTGRADDLQEGTHEPGVAGAVNTPSAARFARTRPTVFVTVPVMTLLGATDEPGELHGVGPIDADTARELAGRAPSFIRILTHPETGARLSIGRDRYAVPSDLRAALVTRDETCRFPGCGRAAEQCEVDHVTDWAHGGRTDATNLAMVCPKHHHLKHETGWSSAPGPDPGTIEWRSPPGAATRATRRHSTRRHRARRSPTSRRSDRGLGRLVAFPVRSRGDRPRLHDARR